MHLAHLFASTGEQRRAIKYYEHALGIDVDCVRAYYGLAKAHLDLKDNKNLAIYNLEELLKRDKTNFKAALLLGQIYLDLKKYDLSA